MDVSKQVIAVLIHTGEKGLTPPVARISDASSSYHFASVYFSHLDYPRLADVLHDMKIDHSGMLKVSYRMGRTIAVFSKYSVQDCDQNLGNWLLGPDFGAVKIDFDLQHTRFVDGAPHDLNFWLWANASKYPKDRSVNERILQQGRALRVFPSHGPNHFSAVSNYNGGRLPPDYDETAYVKRYFEGFRDEFLVPPEVPFEALREAFLRKSQEDMQREEEDMLGTVS